MAEHIITLIIDQKYTNEQIACELHNAQRNGVYFTREQLAQIGFNKFKHQGVAFFVP